jgi:hypothetical protein
MKKLFMLFMLVTFSLTLLGCTPDENTATDMQQWYDACNAIVSCEEKIDEMREKELSESDIILAIQEQLADHEARLQALEARTSIMNKLVNGPSATFDLMTYYDASGIVGLSENEEGDVVILLTTVSIISEEFSAVSIKDAYIAALKSDLSDVYEPETIDIRMVYDIEYGEPDEDGDREEFYVIETVTLSDLLAE